MSAWFVVRSDGVISNAVEWNGVDPYTVDGCSLLPIPDDCPAWIGWTLADAANAAGVEPDHLVAEAEAWAAAKETQ